MSPPGAPPSAPPGAPPDTPPSPSPPPPLPPTVPGGVVKRTVVQQYTIASTVASFDTAAQDSFKQAISDATGIPVSKITLGVAPASILVTVTIESDSDSESNSFSSSLTTLAQSPNLSATLGQPVESVLLPQIEAEVLTPLPPPSTPPSAPPSAPPSPDEPPDQPPPSPPASPPKPPALPPASPPRPPLYPFANSSSAYAWYRQGEFDIQAGTWTDATGNGRTAVLSASGLSSSSVSGNGAAGPVLALEGTTSGSVDFGNIIQATFTICSVTRFTGSSKRRILNGAGGNFLHGHYASASGGLTGVAFYGKVRTAWTPLVTPLTNWVALCGTNGGTYDVQLSGQSVGADTGGTGNVGLGINSGDHMPTDASDFALAELVVWDRALSGTEMTDASCHITRNVLGIASC